MRGYVKRTIVAFLAISMGIAGILCGNIYEVYAQTDQNLMQLNTETSNIPNDAVEYDGNYYKIYDSSMTWMDAKEYCENLGGRLITITSQEENDFIAEYLSTGGKNCYWSGILYSQQDQCWELLNGEKAAYTNWAYGEPNFQNGEENYVHLFGKKYTGGNGTKIVGEWNDASNEGAGYAGDFYALNNFGFICEWGEEIAPYLKNRVEYNGHYYKLLNGCATWEEAKEYCERIGGYLSTITSQQENDFLFEYISSQGVDSAYFGMSDSEKEGEWKWVTGEKVNYANWNSNEPNAESSNEDYAMFYWKYTTGKWNDGNFGKGTVNDGSPIWFICEWETVSSSRLYALTKTNRLTIYENKNSSLDKTADYVLSEGATIVVGNTTHTSKANGTVTIEMIPGGSFVVAKDNYISRTLTTEKLSENKEVYLQKKNSNAPVISGVWVENTDVLHFPYALSMLDKDEITLKAEVDWGSGSSGSIKLLQETKSVNFSGESLTTVISDKFDTSQTIYIVATDAVGNTTKRPLKLQNSSVNKTVDWLDEAELDFSDEISIKLPSNMQPSFLAGMEIGAGLVSTNIPVTVSAEDGKISIVFGVNLNGVEYKKTTYKKGGSYKRKKTTNFIKEMKDTGIFSREDYKKSIKEFKKLKKLYDKEINVYKGKFGVEADFTVMGFAEATYDAEGKIRLLDGGLILNPAVSIEKDFPISVPVGPIIIPLFFETAFSADLEAQLNLLMKKAARQFSPEGELRGEVTLSGGVGVGVKKVLYASGGLEGKVNPLWRIYFDEPDYFKLTASLSGYAKAGINYRFLCWKMQFGMKQKLVNL